MPWFSRGAASASCHPRSSNVYISLVTMSVSVPTPRAKSCASLRVSECEFRGSYRRETPHARPPPFHVIPDRRGLECNKSLVPLTALIKVVVGKLHVNMRRPGRIWRSASASAGRFVAARKPPHAPEAGAPPPRATGVPRCSARNRRGMPTAGSHAIAP